jgi:hypothetical protein
MFLFLESCYGIASPNDSVEQTEVSVKINIDDAKRIVESLKMDKIERNDRYFDFYKDGRYQLSKDIAPFKIRLMSTDQESPKLQTSKITKSSVFKCNALELRSQTKEVFESSDEDGFLGHDRQSLFQLESLHAAMLEEIESRNRNGYQDVKHSLSLGYKDLKFKFKSQLQKLNIEEGFVASYTSSKEKFKTDIDIKSGHKLELSVTFSKNSCRSDCVENDYTIEFQKSKKSKDIDFTEGVCTVLNSLKIGEIKPSPEVNPILAESLKNHIILN